MSKGELEIFQYFSGRIQGNLENYVIWIILLGVYLRKERNHAEK